LSTGLTLSFKAVFDKLDTIRRIIELRKLGGGFNISIMNIA